MILNNTYYDVCETRQWMSVNRVGALLVVCLLLGSVGTLGGVDTTAAQPFEEPIDGIDATDDSDAVYVSETGDAVLVYDRPHETTALEGTFGVETDTGLAHARYEGAIDGDADLIGDATFRSDQASVASSGALLVTDPDSITDLEADIDVRQTERESTSMGDVRATVTDRETAYSSVRTTGDLEVTAGSVTGSGTIHTTAHDDTAAVAETTDALEVTLSETADGTHLTVEERRPVEDWERERWNTRQDASETLENQFSSIAIELGGTADGTLESYQFTEDGDRATVEYEYDVTYLGVDERAAEAAVELVQEQSATDLTAAEARVLADRIESTQFEELWLAVDRDGPRTTIDWSLEASGYEQLVLGTVEIAESIDALDDGLADQFDDVRAVLETRTETDLRQTASWNVSVEDNGEATTIDATWRADAENWAAYTQALEDRDLEALIPETTATVNADTTGEGIDIAYEYETTAEGALDRTLAELERTAGDSSDVVARVRAFHDTFQSAELTRADVTLDDETYELEAAAAAPDGSFETESIADGDELSVSAVYVESTDTSSTVYVVADGYVREEPTGAAVDDRTQVGPETAVYMPGEWEREFPQLDAERAAAFLGTDLDAYDERDGDETAREMIIPLVAGVLVAVALVGYYGRRRG